MARCLSFIVVVFVAAVLFAGKSHSETWTVELTKKQAEGLQNMASQKRNHAFAVSPDGAWGFSEGYNSPELAGTRALQYCRSFIKARRRDCILYAVNGTRVAPETVTVRKVSKIYKPIDGRAAPAFFGLSGVAFQGNRASAVAKMQTKPATPGAMKQDRALRQQLQGKTIVTTAKSGFAIWLGPQRAEHLISTNSGLLTARYEGWSINSDGLLCMFDGYWLSSYQDVGNKCAVLAKIAGGKVDLLWDGSPTRIRKSHLIAGDARWATVK